MSRGVVIAVLFAVLVGLCGSVVGGVHISEIVDADLRAWYKVDDKSADTVAKATLEAMKKLPSEKVKTMTFDNGREFAGFKGLERGLGMRSYFAHPYHSWERGTNENTNGLLRQFFPKGVDFDQISPSDADRAVELLNNRPRKCLNYRTPTEVFWSKTKCCVSD